MKNILLMYALCMSTALGAMEEDHTLEGQDKPSAESFAAFREKWVKVFGEETVQGLEKTPEHTPAASPCRASKCSPKRPLPYANLRVDISQSPAHAKANIVPEGIKLSPWGNRFSPPQTPLPTNTMLKKSCSTPNTKMATNVTTPTTRCVQAFQELTNTGDQEAALTKLFNILPAHAQAAISATILRNNLENHAPQDLEHLTTIVATRDALHKHVKSHTTPPARAQNQDDRTNNSPMAGYVVRTPAEIKYKEWCTIL